MELEICSECGGYVEEWDEADELGRCSICHHAAYNEYQCNRCGEYVDGYDLQLTDHGELCGDCYYHEYEDEEEL